MASIALLAQALPSASSGVDWLYQFTNNLTNLTTQNGGALTQLGMIITGSREPNPYPRSYRCTLMLPIRLHSPTCL